MDNVKVQNEKSDKKQINEMRKKFFSSREKLDNETVLAAISGDTLAIMKIVDIYEPYINKLSKRVVDDGYGGYKEEVNGTVKRILITSLITSIMNFNPYK